MRKNFFKNGLIAVVLGVTLSYTACSDDFNYESSSGQSAGLYSSGTQDAESNPLVGDSVQQYAGLVISKIYFTGSGYIYEPDTVLIRDQYIRITNNSEDIIDAQKVVVLESKFVCGPVKFYNISPAIDSSIFVTEVVYRIPDPTPIEPGESIVLAYQNQEVPGGLNLSGAAYGWEAGSPLLSKIFSYSKTEWIMHNRGFRSYAIGVLPADSATFLTAYKYEGVYVIKTGAGISYVMTTKDAYQIPNEWIIDAVNVVSPNPSERVVQTLSKNLDSGFTWAGNPANSSDTIRFKHAVTRKWDEFTEKFDDTNNSSNDFLPNDFQYNPFIIP
jgi:hypothetical protein